MAVQGKIILNAGDLQPADGDIQDSHVELHSTRKIDCDKVQQHKTVETDFRLDIDAQPTGTPQPLAFRAKAAGTLRHIAIALATTGTTTDIDVDLLKNGTTVMSGGPINITNANSDNTDVDGTITDAPYVAGDRFEWTLVVTTNTGALGIMAYCVREEITE